MNKGRFSLFLEKSMCLQSWTKYLEQDKKIQQNWTEAENFSNCFCTTLLQEICFWKKDRALGSISNQLLRFRSVKSFSNSLDNPALCFFMLDIK